MSRKKSEPIFTDDNPEWTKADFARAERLPPGTTMEELGKMLAARQRGRPKLANPKEGIYLRIDQDVIASYRRGGPGWQTRINADLRKAVKLPSPKRTKQRARG